MTGRPVDSRVARFAPAIVGAVALTTYIRTLLPGIAFGDWGEMQTIPHVLGVAHPTGYPTYIVLSWLTQLVPIGSIALRSNLLSAVLVSGALAVAVAILCRLGARPMIAVAATLALGAVPTVWSAATVAEVNPLHLLFVTLLLHRALIWQERRSESDLVVGALLLGLAIGNHLLVLFVAPFVLVFVLWAGRREIAARPWILVPAAGACLLGLASYLYIPIAAGRSPPLAYNHPVTLDGVVWLVSGTQFRDQFDFLAADGPATFVGSMPALWSLLVDRATPVLPILGVIGLLVLVRQRRAFALMCMAILLMNVYIWANYLRLEHYLLIPWLVLAIGGAIGLEYLARAIHSRLPPPHRRGAGVLIGAAALTFAVGLAAMHWRSSDRSGDRSGEAYVEAVLGALPRDAAILSQWDASTPLWHAQLVLGRRPDILIVDDTNIRYEGWGTRERRIAALMCERPVFILRLRDSDLDSTRVAYGLTPSFRVRIAQGVPTATVTRSVYRVQPLDPTDCARR